MESPGGTHYPPDLGYIESLWASSCSLGDIWVVAISKPFQKDGKMWGCRDKKAAQESWEIYNNNAVGMGWRASWMTWEHFVTIFSWWESIEELLQWHGNTFIVTTISLMPSSFYLDIVVTDPHENWPSPIVSKLSSSYSVFFFWDEFSHPGDQKCGGANNTKGSFEKLWAQGFPLRQIFVEVVIFRQ